MSASPSWPDLIGWFVLIKEEIAEREPSGPYTYVPPRLGASAELLADVERQLGVPLDPQHREFLGYADGWPEFSISVQLLGTADLLGDARETARERLELLRSPQDTDWELSQVLPVGLAMDDRDVVVVGQQGTPLAGQVLWFTGTDVERFPDFRSWYLTQLEWYQTVLERLRATGTSRPARR